MDGPSHRLLLVVVISVKPGVFREHNSSAREDAQCSGCRVTGTGRGFLQPNSGSPREVLHPFCQWQVFIFRFVL